MVAVRFSGYLYCTRVTMVKSYILPSCLCRNGLILLDVVSPPSYLSVLVQRKGLSSGPQPGPLAFNSAS